MDYDRLFTLAFMAWVIGGTLTFGGVFGLLFILLKKLKSKIIAKLRSSDKFMAWLYSDEKSLSEQIYEEFCNAHVPFIRTDWRNYR